jgi:alanine-synthesizing transaminase
LAQAVVGPGDTVLVPNPAYPIHPYGFIIAGADILHIPVGTGDDFFTELEKSVKNTFPKPKMMVLNYPSNPTSECVELEFFERIIAFAKEHQIWVVQDLAYGDICFDGYVAPSILQVEGSKRSSGRVLFTIKKVIICLGGELALWLAMQHLWRHLLK